ncbi:MAG TPA: anaerobic carbon-monoxide dehydrogenase catalytic subunit, partial [Geobacterales bacterium]|nr:anaerobic carbon-monoxide dehydrogenase catalytic subunit [Geobacterales bacterium]
MSVEKTSDPAAREMLEVAKREGYETVWDRLEAQKPQCRMGQEGICCRICSMGPCRINPNGKKPDRGVCGATADSIVARNLVRMIAAGSSSHSDHGRKPALLLREIALGRLDSYVIHDRKKLKQVAQRLGIPTRGRSASQIARRVSAAALASFGNPDDTPYPFLTAYMPKGLQQKLKGAEAALLAATGKQMGLLPRGIDRESVDVLHRTHYGTDHDPLSLLAQGVRCAMADGWGGSLIASEIQDILFGTPQIKTSVANLGVIDKKSVNIVVHGHEPILSEKIIEVADSPAMQELAQSHGAEGVRIIGICCTVNEVLMRKGVAVAGNHLHQELAVMTGAVEAMVVDVQCIFPAMAALSKCFHTRFISTSEQALFPGGQHIQYDEHNAEAVARRIVETAIEAYPLRNAAKVHIPDYAVAARVGFSVESLASALGGSLAPLAAALAQGTLRGVVAIVGCNTPKMVQDLHHVEMAKELIKRDILVVATGCSAIALAKGGLMTDATANEASYGLRDFCATHNIPPILHMGSCVDCSRILTLGSELGRLLKLDFDQLPLVASAPEWTSEKAISIGTYFAASGIPVHLGHIPPIAGSLTVTKILTEDLAGLLGGFFFVEPEPATAVERIDQIIEERRDRLSEETFAVLHDL